MGRSIEGRGMPNKSTGSSGCNVPRITEDIVVVDTVTECDKKRQNQEDKSSHVKVVSNPTRFT